MKKKLVFISFLFTCFFCFQEITYAGVSCTYTIPYFDTTVSVLLKKGYSYDGGYLVDGYGYKVCNYDFEYIKQYGNPEKADDEDNCYETDFYEDITSGISDYDKNKEYDPFQLYEILNNESYNIADTINGSNIGTLSFDLIYESGEIKYKFNENFKNVSQYVYDKINNISMVSLYNTGKKVVFSYKLTENDKQKFESGECPSLYYMPSEPHYKGGGSQTCGDNVKECFQYEDIQYQFSSEKFSDSKNDFYLDIWKPERYEHYELLNGKRESFEEQPDKELHFCSFDIGFHLGGIQLSPDKYLSTCYEMFIIADGDDFIYASVNKNCPPETIEEIKSGNYTKITPATFPDIRFFGAEPITIKDPSVQGKLSFSKENMTMVYIDDDGKPVCPTGFHVYSLNNDPDAKIELDWEVDNGEKFRELLKRVQLYFEALAQQKNINIIGDLPLKVDGSQVTFFWVDKLNLTLKDFQNLEHETIKIIYDILHYCNNSVYDRYKVGDDTLTKRIDECDSFKEMIIEAEQLGLLSNISSECGMLSSDFTTILKEILNLVKIAGPILALGLGTLDFIKAMASGDAEKEMKSAWTRLITRLIAAILLFLIPIILAFLLDRFLGVTPGNGYNPDNPFCIDTGIGEQWKYMR